MERTSRIASTSLGMRFCSPYSTVLMASFSIKRSNRENVVWIKVMH